jgi:hypothetical protein
MPPRVQPRLFFGTVLGGLLLVFGCPANAGFGSGGTTGASNENGVSGTTGTAAAAAASAGGGGRTVSVARSAAPAESGRAIPAAGGAVAREAAVQNGAVQERAMVANQAAYRNGESSASAREANGAEYRATARPANAWTDSRGTAVGRGPGYYAGHQNVNRQNGNHRPRNYQPYLVRYYGGYFPVYVDVPVDYYAPNIDAGYDGGPSVVPDPGNGVAPVIPPSTLNVSAPDDTTSQPDANAANPAPNATPDGSQTPNPAIGPDSLVEAVQAELTRRGYYQGKVDAMFRPDTEAAVRHFQQDNYLAPTGHLNEPTLHALNLD